MPLELIPKSEIDPTYKEMMNIIDELKRAAEEEEKQKPHILELKSEGLNNYTKIFKSKINNIKEEDFEILNNENGIKKTQKRIYIFVNKKIKTESGEYSAEVKIRVDDYIRGIFNIQKLLEKKVEKIIYYLVELQTDGVELDFKKTKKNGKEYYELGDEFKKMILENLKIIL